PDQRAGPGDAGDGPMRRRIPCALFDRAYPFAELPNDLHPARGLVERERDAFDVGENIAQRVRGERNDGWRRPADPLCNRLFDLAHAHRTDVALRLRDDYVGRETAQLVGLDPVDGERLGEDFLDPFVDLGAGALDVEFR